MLYKSEKYVIHKIITYKRYFTLEIFNTMVFIFLPNLKRIIDFTAYLHVPIYKIITRWAGHCLVILTCGVLLPRMHRSMSACVIVRVRCSPTFASFGLWPSTPPPIAFAGCSCDIFSFSSQSVRRRHPRLCSPVVFACPPQTFVISRLNSPNRLYTIYTSISVYN